MKIQIKKNHHRSSINTSGKFKEELLNREDNKDFTSCTEAEFRFLSYLGCIYKISQHKYKLLL